MPTLLELYVSIVSLAWLNYVTMAIGIVILCGGVFVCSHVCAQCFCVSSVLGFSRFCLSVLKRLLIALPPIIDEYLPTTNGAGTNHYILDLRPQYGSDISQIVTDIVGVLQYGSLDYPALENHPNHSRRPRCKFDVKGWRRKLNERWKKKMRFSRRVGYRYRNISSGNYQDESESEANSQSEGSERNRAEGFIVVPLNSREKYSEEFVMVPQSDKDPTVDETIVYPSLMHKVDLLKAKPDGSLVPHYTHEL